MAGKPKPFRKHLKRMHAEIKKAEGKFYARGFKRMTRPTGKRSYKSNN